MIVGVDANVVALAEMLPHRGDSQRNAASARSKLLFENLKTDVVVLPTIALSELLVRVPLERHEDVKKVCRKFFLVHDFDARAASIAAALVARHLRQNSDPQATIENYEKRRMKADAMVIASALSAGATSFYSHDSRCRKLASMVMRAFDLPELPRHLFSEQEFEAD